MAKKKATHQPTTATKPKQQQQPLPQKALDLSPPISRQSSMEDNEEKLHNLKSLNSMLLKETMEKRQLIESLVQAKDALEAQLAKASEENVGLELENGIFWDFVREMVGGVDGLVKERENEIRDLRKGTDELLGKLENGRDLLSRVCRERDEIKIGFDLQVKEANGLKKRVMGLEEKERVLDEKIGTLRAENHGLIVEKKNGEGLIEDLTREKSNTERSLREKTEEIEGLKRDIEVVVREKEEIAKEKRVWEGKVGELEKELGKLNEVASRLRKEEEVLRGRVLELEKSCSEAVEKEKEMASEIDALVKEKKGKESNIEKLMEDKSLVEKQMEMAVMECKEKEKSIDALSRKASELQEHVVNREAVLVELNREASELRDVVSTLKKGLKDQDEKNEGLIHEISQLKDALGRVTFDRDNAEKSLAEEKKNGLNLRSKVSELEKGIEETEKELQKIRNDCMRLKSMMEDMSDSLGNEKNILEKDLSEAKKAIDALQAKLESAGINSERAMAMLKSTAAMLCRSKDAEDGVIDEKKLEKEMEPYAAELEAIKKAFRNKENLVEDMKREVESMKHSVAQAHKRKSFWTVVSSMTIFAAASIAYVSKGR